VVVAATRAFDPGWENGWPFGPNGRTVRKSGPVALVRRSPGRISRTLAAQEAQIRLSFLEMNPQTLRLKRMDLPIRFPSDSDVIAEEAARFRALSPEARMRSIRNLLEAGAWMMRQSPKAAFLEE
jgi:hypothetical protein